LSLISTHVEQGLLTRMAHVQVCTTAKERMQQVDAWRCMGAVQTALCAACRDGVMQSLTAGAAALSAAHIDNGRIRGRWDSESWKSKQRGRRAAIDKRLLVRLHLFPARSPLLPMICNSCFRMILVSRRSMSSTTSHGSR
jgi:hypothetical protein